MNEKARNISDEAFATAKDSVMVKLQEKDKNMGEEFAKHKAELVYFKFNFNRQEQEIEILKAITKEEWQKYFEVLFGDNARRLDIRYNSKAHQEQEAKNEFIFDNETKLPSINAFKNSCSLYPDSYKNAYAECDWKL